MGRSTFIFVSDNSEQVQKVQSFALQESITLQVYSSQEWGSGLHNSDFLSGLSSGYEDLVSGGMSSQSGEGGATVIPFPTNRTQDKKVSTMNELESMAIENAINEYRGNLTEAAKALGIGRATLYRKVKLYQLDPASARRKRKIAA